MFVVAHNGETYRIDEVIMKSNKIYGTTKKTKQTKAQEVLLGEYEDNQRTCTILAELTCLSWNNDKEQNYTMPEK